MGGIIGLFIYIQITLSDKGKIDPADGAKNIGLSYIQVISLLANFPIAWPDIFVSIFKIGGAVAVLGQHLVNLKCMYPKNSEADVFYTTRIIWAILPVALPLICTLVWLIIHKLKGVINVQAKIKASITALLYLIWPGLCSETFAMFSCRDVCGKTLLRVDLEEECGEGRHFIYSRYLGIPMLIVYVIGLPLIAFIMVILVRRRAARLGAKVETRKGHITFGLFYSAYDPKIWWWEITVTIRKIFVAYIGVFGGALGEMQVHLTGYVMFVVIVLTAVIQPFGKNILLQFLELGTLAATWMTLWAGTVFNTFPRCEDDKGIAVGWCNTLSIFIGLLNIAAVVAVIIGFIYYKQQKRCNACGKMVLIGCFAWLKVGGGEEISGPTKVTSSMEEKKQGGDDDGDDEIDNVTIEMAEMVGSPTPSGSPIRMQDVTVALPSPAKKKSLGGKKVGDADAGGVAMPSVMHFNGDKKNATRRAV